MTTIINVEVVNGNAEVKMQKAHGFHRTAVRAGLVEEQLAEVNRHLQQMGEEPVTSEEWQKVRDVFA